MSEHLRHLEISHAIGMSTDDAHVFLTSIGWVFQSEHYKDYRQSFAHPDGPWVRYYTSLHEDNVERIDGIDYQGNYNA